MTAPTNAGDVLAVPVLAYRLHTGSPRAKWQWMDGPPSAGAIGEVELHGWEIEYAYDAAAVAAIIDERDALKAQNPRDTPFGREAAKLADDYLQLSARCAALEEDRDALRNALAHIAGSCDGRAAEVANNALARCKGGAE